MKYFLALIATFMFLGCQSQNETSGTNVQTHDLKTPKTELDKISYTIGFDLGSNFKNDSIEIDTQYFLAGLIDGLNKDTANVKALLTQDERMQTMQDFQLSLQEKHEQMQQEKLAAQRAKGETFKIDGQKYLDNFKKQSGVKTLPSGIAYKIVNQGKGKKPTSNSVVKMHLVAKFTDGSELDNTYKNGEPAILPVNQLIPGWQEIIPLMSIGSKWEVVVPPALAYGENGWQDIIPPNSTMIFEMELLEIVED